MRARLASTYGWTLEYIDGLYFDDAVLWVEEAEELERQRLKALVLVASYPHMDKDGKRAAWRDLSKPTKRPAKPKVNPGRVE